MRDARQEDPFLRLAVLVSRIQDVLSVPAARCLIIFAKDAASAIADDLNSRGFMPGHRQPFHGPMVARIAK